MKKIMLILLGVIFLNCINIPKNNSSISSLENNLIEIEYSVSKAKTINELKEIWDCKIPIISKSESNFNGELTNSIVVIMNQIKDVDSKKRDENYILTKELIKNNIKNYRDFDEVKIITSIINKNSEKSTFSKTYNLSEL